jgi:iron complex outermembrane receptor protein
MLGSTALLVLLPFVTSTTQQPAPPPVPTPKVVERVVVTASVAPSPADGVNRTVTVVTRADLERLGLSSVIEGLRLVPGLDPRARGPQDIQTDFSIRGATFGQTLMLVDGIRVNDSQSGHHNGDLPTAVAGIDRVEIVTGGSSAVHGADALGGVVNLISRRDTHALATISAGQHGTIAGQASVSGMTLPKDWTVTGWAARSGGFMFDRDYRQGGASVRGAIRPDLLFDVRHQRKAFGANGFYGASASFEWTDQTMVALTHRHVTGPWVTEVRGSARNHGDHFRWDIFRPGFAENRHRTYAGESAFTAERDFSGGRRLTIGASGGGDVVNSSNLANHRYGRGSGFAEMQLPVASRTIVQGGIRLDSYSNFGSSWNPSVGISTWVRPAFKLRASLAKAFRIPTFTELYYHDPGNLGTPSLQAEHGWSLDAGGELAVGGWSLSVTPFRRWDTDVIDWVKLQLPDLWRSTNVRDVTTTGIETRVSRTWQSVFFQMAVTRLKVDAPALTANPPLLSKYVNEYARHSTVGSIGLPLGRQVRFVLNVDHRHRLDGQNYSLVSARFSRQVRHMDLFVSGTNLVNENYREIVGVAMPGRWVMAGVTLR